MPIISNDYVHVGELSLRSHLMSYFDHIAVLFASILCMRDTDE